MPWPFHSTAFRRGNSNRLVLLWVATLLGASACSEVTTVDLLPPKAQGGLAGRSGSPPIAGASGWTSGWTSRGGFGTSGGNGGVAGTNGSPLGPRLVNRYDFSGTGTVVVDSISGKHGEVMGGAALNGVGQLTLSGNPSQYVRLPAWLLSSMQSVTIVTWFTWHGGPSWQSVFNFGYNDDNSSVPSESVRAEFFFTPLMVPPPGASLHVDVVYGGSINFVNTDQAFPVDEPTVVAAVVDGELQQIRLYIDGALIGAPNPWTEHLAELKDANCWLGQSQWLHDVENGGNFRGTYDEFRIYDGALTTEQIQRLTPADPMAM